MTLSMSSLTKFIDPINDSLAAYPGMYSWYVLTLPIWHRLQQHLSNHSGNETWLRTSYIIKCLGILGIEPCFMLAHTTMSKPPNDAPKLRVHIYAELGSLKFVQVLSDFHETMTFAK